MQVMTEIGNNIFKTECPQLIFSVIPCHLMVHVHMYCNAE